MTSSAIGADPRIDGPPAPGTDGSSLWRGRAARSGRTEIRGQDELVIRGLTGEVDGVEVAVPEADSDPDACRRAEAGGHRPQADGRVGDELPRPHAAPGTGLRARVPMPPAPLPAGARGRGPGRRLRHRRPDGLGMVLHARSLRLRRGPGRRGRVPPAHPLLHRAGRQGLEPSGRVQRGGHPGEVRREGSGHPHLGCDQDPPEPRGAPPRAQGCRVEGAGPQGDARTEGAGDVGRSGPLLVRLRHGRAPRPTGASSPTAGTASRRRSSGRW